MRLKFALMLVGSSLASAAAAAPISPPILTGTPSAKAITQRCDMFVTRSTTMRKALETSKGKASVNTTLAAFDHIYQLLGDASGEATLYREVMPTEASRTAGEKCEVRIAAEYTKLSLSRPIYERLKAIEAPTDAPTKWFLSRALGAFERSGIGLDAAGRATAQEISERESKLSTQVAANIPKGQRTITVTAAERW